MRLAVALNRSIRRPAVQMWRVRGIPWRYRHAVARLLRNERYPVPEGFLTPETKERSAHAAA
jgi:hypothetical protein